MKKTEKKDRLTLTILYSIIVFLVQFFSIMVAGIAAYIFIKTGVLTEDGGITLRSMISFMGFVSLMIGIILTVVSSKISLRPVNKLINKMNGLASGDFGVRLNFNGPFSKTAIAADVEDSFNTMAAELQNTEMLRNDFINNFSHEFKTPIVSIAGFAKLIKKGNLNEEQKKEYLDVIEEESLRLAYMATNVLSITEIENQSILADVEEFNLSEQLRACILLLERKWEEKEIEFSLEFGEYEISAGRELLKQVWINLLDNAIKFSPQGGTVEVGIENGENEISVSVTNSGKDIRSEEQKRIFGKFYQADESHAAEGNGIGLAIVKSVANLHRGSVSVESGTGKTTFTVSLPKNVKK